MRQIRLGLADFRYDGTTGSYFASLLSRSLIVEHQPTSRSDSWR
jgi:hypothetical protein